MTEYWMINVLADLRKFAKDKRMGKLVAQLDDTIYIAASEMTPDDEPVESVDYRPDDTSEYTRSATVV